MPLPFFLQSSFGQCICDDGYTGADCSERFCPTGVDPELNCPSTERISVQEVVVSFGSMPADVVLPRDMRGSDELALEMPSEYSPLTGTNLSYWVPRVAGIWAGDFQAAEALGRALQSLPRRMIDGVTVTAFGPTPFSPASVTFSVTFDGEHVQGNMPGLLCPDHSFMRGQGAWAADQLQRGATFLRGCAQPGCRPLYKQMRVLSLPEVDVGIRVNETLSVLLQPPELHAGDALQPGRWGVTVTISVATRAGLGQTWSVATRIYDESSGPLGTAAVVPETPLPPAGTDLRRNIKLPYGLVVNFDQALVQDGDHTFRWKIPFCHTAITRPASPDAIRRECSGRGICNRKSGECMCNEGYGGHRCMPLGVATD